MLNFYLFYENLGTRTGRNQDRVGYGCCTSILLRIHWYFVNNQMYSFRCFHKRPGIGICEISATGNDNFQSDLAHLAAIEAEANGRR